MFPNIFNYFSKFQSYFEVMLYIMIFRIRKNNSKFTILLNNMRLMAIWDWLELARDYLGHCYGDATSLAETEADVSGDPMLKKASFKSSEAKRKRYVLVLVQQCT